MSGTPLELLLGPDHRPVTMQDFREAIQRLSGLTAQAVGSRPDWAQLIRTAAEMRVTLSDVAQDTTATRSLLAQLPTLTNLQQLHEAIVDSLATRPEWRLIAEVADRRPENRTFFANQDSALAAAQLLLSNRPASNPTVASSELPIQELYGYLNALHANRLLWDKHIDATTDRIERFLRANSANWACADAGRTLLQMRDEYLRPLHQAVLDHLPDPVLNANISEALGAIRRLTDRVGAIEQRLGHLGDDMTAMQEDVHRLVEELPHQRAQPTREERIAEAYEQLPAYRATHPRLHTRTHGRLTFDNLHVTIPMDVLQRPASTALHLKLALEKKSWGATLHATMYDAGALIFSRTIDTSSRLAQMPGDALHLLHATCPNFLYKLGRENAC